MMVIKYGNPYIQIEYVTKFYQAPSFLSSFKLDSQKLCLKQVICGLCRLIFCLHVDIYVHHIEDLIIEEHLNHFVVNWQYYRVSNETGAGLVSETE